MEGFEVKLLILLVLAVQFQGNYGCFEEERLGLLAFKSFVQANADNADQLLPTWTNHTADCCHWERVTCSSSTGHVTKLSLDDTKKAWDDGNYQNLTIWYLDLSIFEPFKELITLNLSINAIAELVDDGNNSDRFSKLENLDLSWNLLGSQVFKTLGKFPTLRYIDLNNNVMQATLSEIDLAGLRNMKVLILQMNDLNGTLPIYIIKFVTLSDNFLSGLVNLNSLETLDLSSNQFTGSIPENMQRLQSLKALSLSENDLDGYIHQGLCQLEQLEELDISKNSFSGTLPLCLSKLTSLRLLDLSSNRLSGKIPSGFGNLNRIHSLNLSKNHLTGSITKIFSNMSRIESIDLSHNKLSGGIPPQLTSLSLLKFFSVAYNNLSGRIPEIKGASGKNSYEGNPFLCGFPLVKRCGK